MEKVNYGLLTTNSIIEFGRKHKGKLVSQVLKDDPSYIMWAVENIKDIDWSPDVLAIARDTQIPPFVFKVEDLAYHERTLNNLEKGLDPIGNNGVRHLHGFGDKDDIHKSLNYIKKLLDYIQTELIAKHSLYIKL